MRALSRAPTLAGPIANAINKRQHRFRSGNGIKLGQREVISLYLGKIINVVDHNPMRLPQSIPRQIGIRVDGIKPRAIAKVEPGDRVDDTATR